MSPKAPGEFQRGRLTKQSYIVTNDRPYQGRIYE